MYENRRPFFLKIDCTSMKSTTNCYSFVASHLFWKPFGRSTRNTVLYKSTRLFSIILFLLEEVAFQWKYLFYYLKSSVFVFFNFSVSRVIRIEGTVISKKIIQIRCIHLSGVNRSLSLISALSDNLIFTKRYYDRYVTNTIWWLDITVITTQNCLENVSSKHTSL